MINRNNKKGFTIVELVIVIAVIAILAAVLIPTFAGIIAKANESADIKAVREMNTALTAEFAVEKPDEGDMEAVINALEKNGFNSLDSIKPISKDYKFVWSYVDCCIILLNADDEIVFPAAETLKFELTAENIENNDLDGGVKYVDAVVADADALAQAVANGQKDITLETDITVVNPMSVNSDITINLNGKKLNASGNASRPFDLTNNATLTINAEGSIINCGAYGFVDIRSGGTLVINGGTFVANTNKGSFLKPRAGDISITLNNVSYTDNSNNGFVVNSDGFAGTMTIVVNGGNFEAQNGFVVTRNITVKDATITARNILMEISDAEATFTNCTIKNTATAGSTYPAGVSVSNGGVVTVKNSTIIAAYAYDVLPTGGTINAENNTLTVTDTCMDRTSSTTATAKIVVDGQTIYEVVK